MLFRGRLAAHGCSKCWDAAPISEIDAIPDLIVQALTDWRGGRALEDDLTVVALKRT